MGVPFAFHGEFYDIPKPRITPAPTRPIPILIGGHADAELRRAARCDGWMHGGGDAEELERLIARLKEIRAEEGRTGPFEIHVISADGFTLDGIKRLEDKGVTDVIVGFRIPAEKVIAKARASGQGSIDGAGAEHIIQHHRGAADDAGPVPVRRRHHLQHTGGYCCRFAVQRFSQSGDEDVVRAGHITRDHQERRG